MSKIRQYLYNISVRLRAIPWHKLGAKVTVNFIIFVVILGLATFAFWMRWSAFRVKPLPLEPFVKETPLPNIIDDESTDPQLIEIALPQPADTDSFNNIEVVRQGEEDITSIPVDNIDLDKEELFVTLPPTDPAIEVEMALAPSEVWQWPVDGQIVKAYGMVYWPTTNDWRTHTGIDIEVPSDSNIVAARAGTVQVIKQNESWGWAITLSHPNGYQTIYSACEEVNVKLGTFVEAGQVIARSGNSAALEMALPPHLHFEVRYRGEALDPRAFLPQS